MKKLLKFAPIILIFLLVDCGKNVIENAIPFSYDSFEKVDILQVVSLDHLSQENISEMPSKIAVIDTLLFVLDPYSEYYIYVFNLNDGSLIRSFITKGRGPDEIIDTRTLNFSDNRTLLTIDDPNQQKIFIYNVEDIRSLPESSFIRPHKVIDHNEYGDDPTFMISGDIILSNFSAFSTKRYTIINSKGEQVNSICDFPKLTKNKDKIGLPSIFDANYVVNEENTRIAVFNRFTDLLEIYGLDGERIISKQGPDGFLPVYQVHSGEYTSVSMPDGEARRSYTRPIGTKDKIWVLYSGSFIDIADTYNKIMVFDWEGNPLRMYVLPCSLSSFDVDTDNNLIYGLTIQDDNFKIIKFSF